jgi:LmbE family N-acetylglucosaminyl deacetylase
MQFHQSGAEIFVPDGMPTEQALARTTHMAVSAHQDDIEIMAAEPILHCYQREDLWFTGVVATDGSGSPREGLYGSYSDEQMRAVRIKEQKKAAFIGEYAAQVMLDYPSSAVKDGRNPQPVEDLATIFALARPAAVYTHNLTDKHDTHVAVALRVITALRSLPEADRPQKLYGCEVWRDLDWMVDADKLPMDLSQRENLQAALLGVFDSQIAGGKRYDLATLGRRRANATYYESHGLDTSLGLSYAMDLTPLIQDVHLDIAAYIQAYIDRFARDVADRLGRVG